MMSWLIWGRSSSLSIFGQALSLGMRWWCVPTGLGRTGRLIGREEVAKVELHPGSDLQRHDDGPCVLQSPPKMAQASEDAFRKEAPTNTYPKLVSIGSTLQ
ncbi:hypothetical protein C8Q78DRAFT_29418 [Trametes maxima]|nr:hypothetical protein C8Q78DRAFT_29418 [Trametes maxima]